MFNISLVSNQSNIEKHRELLWSRRTIRLFPLFFHSRGWAIFSKEVLKIYILKGPNQNEIKIFRGFIPNEKKTEFSYNFPAVDILKCRISRGKLIFLNNFFRGYTLFSQKISGALKKFVHPLYG